MLYFANPCNEAAIEAMRAGSIGLIDTPIQGKVKRVQAAHDAGAVWCADNGAFSSRWDAEKWWAWLNHPNQTQRIPTCAFATAPDIVGDAVGTLALSAHWMPRIRALGFPVALVAQDGLEHLPIPWDEFDALFIGGSTDWKLGPAAAGIVAQAKELGKWVHMGRVNSRRRLAYAVHVSCDSADGTYLTFGPDLNLPKLLGWVGDVRTQGMLW